MRPQPAGTVQNTTAPQETVEIKMPLSKLERAGIGALIGAAAAGATLALAGSVGIGLGAAAVGIAALGGGFVGARTWSPYEPELPFRSVEDIKKLPEFGWTVPTRDQQLNRLKDSGQNFDVLVIGGGATGAGTALEAARRGLSVAALEGSDFSAGTSSKSTKLIHGGVRYLEKAVKNLDKEQWELVKEGLHERRAFLDMAPHLTDEVRLVTPVYSPWELPYYYTGLALYDMLAGREALEGTEMLSKREMKERLPDVNDEGLWGGVAYSDGEFNDSRMNVGLATTAAAHGAAVANHVKVKSLLKDAQGKVIGVQAEDQLTGESWPIRAKVVINATGPYIDGIRKMDDPQAPDLVVPSAGTHIVVDDLNLPEGLLVPKAPNGSVAFFKPFEGGHLIGTTEEPTALTLEPQTSEAHVDYLIGVANQYLDQNSQIDRGDLTSVWTGIRPLVKDPGSVGGGTESISRKHIIDVSNSGLVTIGGGKWTAFGRMAEEVVEKAVQEGGLQASPSQREGTRLIGAHGYSEGLAADLESHYGLDGAVAEHLARNYGDRAVAVAEIAKNDQLGARLHPDHPYLEAEVVYAAKHEYAATPVDVLSRRTRLSFVDEKATAAALPRTVQLMSTVLGWDAAQSQQQLASANAFYQRNGLSGVTP